MLQVDGKVQAKTNAVAALATPATGATDALRQGYAYLTGLTPGTHQIVATETAP